MDDIAKHIKEVVSEANAIRRKLAEAQGVSANAAWMMELRKDFSNHLHSLLEMEDEYDETVLNQERPSEALFAPMEKRKRGGQEQHYLADSSQKESFLKRIRWMIEHHYMGGKRFLLTDRKTEVKAKYFITSIYLIGIKQGYASAEAPMRDFSDLFGEVVNHCANAQDLNTAYNTIQKEKKRWLEFLDGANPYANCIYLHKIDPGDVVADKWDDYQYALHILDEVEKIWNGIA